LASVGTDEYFLRYRVRPVCMAVDFMGLTGLKP